MVTTMSDLSTELAAYDVTRQPVMTGSHLAWDSLVSTSVQPYEVTRLPHCTVHGLWDALRQAAIGRPEPVAAMERLSPWAEAIIRHRERRLCIAG
jgi:hypothetical protein